MQRKDEAMRLELSWPLRDGPRRVGRPNRQEEWDNALARALLENRFDELAKLLSKNVPEWYRGGRTVVQSTEPINVAQEVLRTERQDEWPSTHQKHLPPAKRQKMHVPRHAQKWFLAWSSRMRGHGWTMQACLREAKAMCPELLDGLNEASIYRWSKPSEPSNRGPGRPPLIP